jgi:hypothetical protein
MSSQKIVVMIIGSLISIIGLAWLLLHFYHRIMFAPTIIISIAILVFGLLVVLAGTFLPMNTVK